ncbi:hypothetical protein [Paraburkholderia youngii]|uniref:hypothetical protein n=1 Tax=Paraburkholderia youngii TaxID=2782701 RepID=UPI003D23D415
MTTLFSRLSEQTVTDIALPIPARLANLTESELRGPIPEREMIHRCLPPRLALEVLRGTSGNRDVFLPLAGAVSMSGLLAAMGIELERLPEIKAAQHAVAKSFVAGNTTGNWVIQDSHFPVVAAGLEIYDRQLSSAPLSAALAAEHGFAEQMRLNREAKEARRKAA